MSRRGFQPERGLERRRCAAEGCSKTFVPYTSIHRFCSRLRAGRQLRAEHLDERKATRKRYEAKHRAELRAENRRYRAVHGDRLNAVRRHAWRTKKLLEHLKAFGGRLHEILDPKDNERRTT